MIIRAAREEDTRGFIELAGQVEHWFGPMAAEPGFRAGLTRHISRGTAWQRPRTQAKICSAACSSVPALQTTTCTGSSSTRPEGGSRQVYRKPVT
jgi:hypothetical protein